MEKKLSEDIRIPRILRIEFTPSGKRPAPSVRSGISIKKPYTIVMVAAKYYRSASHGQYAFGPDLTGRAQQIWKRLRPARCIPARSRQHRYGSKGREKAEDEGKEKEDIGRKESSSVLGNGREYMREDYPTVQKVGRLLRLGERAVYHGRGLQQGCGYHVYSTL